MKIQPNEFARNGMGMAMRPTRANHLLSVTRPLRVSHSAMSARSTEPAAMPIMSRKDQ